MKVFKYSFMVLTFAIVANVTMTYADRYLENWQIGVTGTAEIHVGQSVKAEAFVKERFGTQSFYNQKTFTTSTDPCPKCDILATLQKRVNGTWSDVKSSNNTRMGQRNYFNGNTAEAPGVFRLSIKRNNLTAAITYVLYEWEIQPAIN